MSPGDIEFERLADWAEGRLPAEEARAVEEDLAAAGEDARAAAGWLRAFFRVSEGIVLDEPPAGARDELVRRFEEYAEGRRQPEPLRRLVATLSFEGGAQAAFGVRSAASGESQAQLVYTTGAADIALDIRWRPGDGSLDLDGQVFPTDATGPDDFSVQLLSGATEVGTTATDALGEFAFRAIEPGEYQILVSSGRVEILISPLKLGA
jgi:hypothetical protein